MTPSNKPKNNIENSRDWRTVATAFVHYHIVTEDCFSSGEIARDIRLYRPELVFSVGELGAHIRQLHTQHRMPDYDDGFSQDYPVTTTRTTTGLGRTPAGKEVVVYGPSQSTALQHDFEVDIPPPGGPKQLFVSTGL